MATQYRYYDEEDLYYVDQRYGRDYGGEPPLYPQENYPDQYIDYPQQQHQQSPDYDQQDYSPYDEDEYLHPQREIRYEEPETRSDYGNEAPKDYYRYDKPSLNTDRFSPQQRPRYYVENNFEPDSPKFTLQPSRLAYRMTSNAPTQKEKYSVSRTSSYMSNGNKRDQYPSNGGYKGHKSHRTRSLERDRYNFDNMAQALPKINASRQYSSDKYRSPAINAYNRKSGAAKYVIPKYDPTAYQQPRANYSKKYDGVQASRHHQRSYEQNSRAKYSSSRAVPERYSSAEDLRYNRRHNYRY